ncbi:restriction endonuclease subunit S [Marinomonas posidonica]|uniref:restriction endonuclease subunit S n=1 Tax=Marinomonas posidonica TaxID=936476 RepID=UPI0037352CC6
MVWATAKLGELAQINYGYTAKASFETDGPKFLRITDIQNGVVNWSTVPSCELSDQDFIKHKLETNDIVFARTGATTGKSFLIKEIENSVAASYLIRLRLTSCEILPEFVYIFFQTSMYWDLVEAGSSGSAQGGFNASKLSNLEINFPSLPEQKRIVSILDTVFFDLEQTRAKTEQNLKNARELFDSYLQQVFSQKGESWEELDLESLVSDDCSLSYGIVQPGDDFNNGLPVVRPTDLKTEFITPNGLKLIEPAKSEGYKRTVLQGEELLVCVRGSTGITSIACKSLAGANVTRGIVPVRFNPELISSRFGYYQFISPLVQSQIKDATYGAALMQINIRDFRKIKVSTPSIKVQKALVKKLDSIRPDLTRAEEIYKQKLLALDELKKSILQKAFSGELTKIVE